MSDSSNAETLIAPVYRRHAADALGACKDPNSGGGLCLGSLAHWRALLDAQPASQLLVEIATGCVLHANPAAAARHGRGVAAMRTATLYDLLETEYSDMSDVVDALLDGQRRHVPTWRRTGADHCEIVTLETTPVEIEGAGPALHIRERGPSARPGATDGAARDEHAAMAFYRAAGGPRPRFVRVDRALMRLFEASAPEDLHAVATEALQVDVPEHDRFAQALETHGAVFRRELRWWTFGGREIRTATTARRGHDEHGNPVIDGVIEQLP